jgi:hypothetical protein
MLHFWAGAVLERLAPDAKVLVILRDPVERYCSGIGKDRGPAGVNHASEVAQFFRGFYGEQLARLAPYVEDRLLVLQYERCVRERQSQLERTFRFLGVEPVEVANIDDVVGTSTPRSISAERRALLVEAYRPDVAMLAARYPEVDVSLWKNFA